MRRARRFAIVAVVSAMLLAVPLGPHASGAEDLFGGYDMRASATAVSVIYNQPSFGLPTDPTFELRKVHSESGTDSGPSGRALASVVWPGDAAGNADPALVLDLVLFDPTRDDTPEDGGYFSPLVVPTREGIKQGAADGCKDTNCTYPVRAEAFYPEAQGHPGESEFPLGGGARMWARAREAAAEAVTTTQQAGQEAVLSIGAMSSRTFTGIRKNTVVAEATTYLQNVDLLGLLHFDSIKSVVTSSSDGTKATPASSVTVTGMRIDAACRQPGANQKTCSVPIFVDEDGMHVQSDKYDPTGGEAAKAIKQYLEPNGISLVVTPSTTLVEGAQAEQGVSGVIVRLNATGMANLVDQLPEQMQTWLRAPSSKDSPFYEIFQRLSPTVAGYASSLFQGDQTMMFVFGSASVNAVAAPAFNFELPPIDTPPIDFGPGEIPPPVDFGGGIAPPPFDPGTPPGRTPRTVIDAVPVGVKGLPAGLGALAGLLGLLSALVLPRFAEQVTSAGAAGEQCDN